MNLEPPPNESTPVEHPQFRQWIYQLWERVTGRRATAGTKNDDGLLLAAFRSNRRTTTSGSTAPTLTATYVGYGSGVNTLTGDANLTWNSGTATLRATNIQSTAIGTSTAAEGVFTTLNAGIPANSDTFLGGSAGNLSASGTNNVAVGTNAMNALSSGSNNVVVGSNAGKAISSGGSHTALGNAALKTMATGTNCTAVGASALELCTGNGNTAVGSASGDAVTSATNNTLVGTSSGGAITTSSDNVAIGVNALQTQTTGTGRNVAVGVEALKVATGTGSVAVGWQAGIKITSGVRNTALGTSAISGIVTVDDCTGIGYQTGFYNTGAANTFVGSSSGFGDVMGAQTANNCTGLGYRALYAIDSGSGCTAVGYNAGNNMASNSNSMCLGNGSTASSSSVSNEITLGNTSIATIRAQVTTITAISDARDKTDIEDLPVGLDFINSLRPRRFTWNMRDGGKVGIQDYGFIAQELKAAQGDKDWLSLVYESNPDRLEASAGKLIPVLVKAIQELSAEVERLKNA
jgi:hypothetical protein